jgi:hypothetical protein
VTCVEDSTRRTHPSTPTPKSLPVRVVSCWIPTIVSCTIFPTQSRGTALFSVTSHLLTLASTTAPTLKRQPRRLLLTPGRRTSATRTGAPPPRPFVLPKVGTLRRTLRTCFRPASSPTPGARGCILTSTERVSRGMMPLWERTAQRGVQRAHNT